MFKSLAFSFLIVFIFSCSDNKGTKFYTDKNLYDDGTTNYGISYLFKLSRDSVYNSDRKSVQIKIPSEFKDTSVAWGSLYVGVFKNLRSGGEAYFLINNYNSANPMIIFDKKGDLDFTNDSSFQIQKDSTFFIEFENQRRKVRLKFKFYHGITDTSQTEIHRLLTYGKGTALPPEYMVLTKDYYIKKILLKDGNVISIKDVDFDGIFTSKYDKIIAGDLTKFPGLLKQRLKCKKVKSGEELIFENNTYRVEKIDKYGEYVSLTALNVVMDSIEKLPDIDYIDTDGKEKQLVLQKNKELSVFYIWGTWCIGCHFQSKELARLMNEYDQKANFYTLNTGDKKDKMVTYVQKNNYPFQLYRISASDAENKLFAEAFPTFIIIDNEKKILLRTSYVNEVENYLKQ